MAERLMSGLSGRLSRWLDIVLDAGMQFLHPL